MDMEAAPVNVNHLRQPRFQSTHACFSLSTTESCLDKISRLHSCWLCPSVSIVWILTDNVWTNCYNVTLAYWTVSMAAKGRQVTLPSSVPLYIFPLYVEVAPSSSSGSSALTVSSVFGKITCLRARLWPTFKLSPVAVGPGLSTVNFGDKPVSCTASYYNTGQHSLHISGSWIDNTSLLLAERSSLVTLWLL